MDGSKKLSRAQFLQLLVSIVILVIVGFVFRIPFASAVPRGNGSIGSRYTEPSKMAIQNRPDPLIREVLPKRLVPGITIIMRGIGLHNCQSLSIGGVQCNVTKKTENLIISTIPQSARSGLSTILIRDLYGKDSKIGISILETFAVVVLSEPTKMSASLLDANKYVSYLVEQIQSHLGSEVVVVKRIFPYTGISTSNHQAYNLDIDYRNKALPPNNFHYRDRSLHEVEFFERISTQCKYDSIPKKKIDLIFFEKNSGEILFMINPNCDKIEKISSLLNGIRPNIRKVDVISPLINKV